MKVTVLETVERSADITAEMVREYLLRHGAIVVGGRGREWSAFGYGAAGNYVNVDEGELPNTHRAKLIVERIAWLEGRRPHEVLADIASGK